ncbi:MAG: cytochrome c biogenesis protein [Flavobacteriales bacterium]|jgi:cytochrome c biogenesis protein|tara:strand:- start:2242 stop:3552 length:1311 start_codon:yes stop_codon:yes gene_type:complete
MLKTVNRNAWLIANRLGNLQFAIVLLLLIASFSSIGTFIEQGKDVAFYELNYPNLKPLLGFVNAKFIFLLGLDHVYTTWWFIINIFLFVISLFSCTLIRQLPSLKFSRLWRFYDTYKSMSKFNVKMTMSDASLTKLSFQLKNNNYNVVQEGGFIYAYKGLIGRISPIIVHASIILILFGSVIGSASGFMTQELVPTNNLFHLRNIVNSGPFSFVPQNIEGYVKDFKIAYSDEGIIDQFYSDLSILDTNIDLLNSKTIYVNEPLRYKGIVFYQTDWGITSLTVSVDNDKVIEIPLTLVDTVSNNRFWIYNLSQLTSLGIENALLVLQDLTGKLSLYDSNKNIVAELQVGDEFFLNGHSLRVTDIIPATGLQVKSDPGTLFVYLGFLMLMISTLLSYVSYSQIWAFKSKNNLYVAGQTNRAVYYFEKHFGEMLLTTKK